MKGSGSTLGKLDRKTAERNRRVYMKGLFSELASLIAPQHFQPSSKQALLECAASYIKQLRDRVDELKEKKEECARLAQWAGNSTHESEKNNRAQRIEVIEVGYAIQVVLICGLEKNFVLHQVIGVLEEEGVEVVSAGLNKVGCKIFHIIQCQVRISRVGVEITRLRQRLQDLIH